MDQLTEKRKKKLDAIALQEEKLRQQNAELNYQITINEKVEEFVVNESDDSNLDLENELKDLQDKLNVLIGDYSQLNEEDRACKAANEDIDNKFHESIFLELETK